MMKIYFSVTMFVGVNELKSDFYSYDTHHALKRDVYRLCIMSSYLSICLSVYLWVCTYIHINLFTRTYQCVCVCVLISINLCVRVSMYT